MDVSTKSFATAGDALYLSQGYLANGGTYTPGAAPLFVNQDNEITFAFSGTHSGWYLQPYGVTPAGQLIPLAVKSDQSGQLVQYAAAGIAPVANSANSWVYDFPPGKFADCYFKVVTAGTGTPTAEIFSGRVHVNPAITVAIPTVNAIGTTGGTTVLSGFLQESATTGLTARAGGGQTSALLLTTEVNTVTTVASAGDSVKLPLATGGGLTIPVINLGANSLQVYGSGTDTINGVASATGVSQMVNSVVLYVSYASGLWVVEGVETGYAGNYATSSFANGLTALAGGAQAGTAVTTAIARFTTVAAPGNSAQLPTSSPGLVRTIINAGANAMAVFGQTGDVINGLPANVATSLPAGQTAVFICAVAGTWNMLAIQPREAQGTLTTNGAGTILAATIVGGDLLRTVPTTAFTDTSDTAANIIAALHGATIGQSWEWTYQNQTSTTATLAGGSGATLAATVPPASWARFIVTYTAANTVTFTLINTGPLAVMPGAQYTSISSGNGTLTGAQVAGANYVALVTSGATALTTPTAANILAAIPNGVVGVSYVLRIVNTNGGTLTITADASVTATGTLTLSTNTFRDWVVTIATATTATMKQIGTGTTS